MIGYTLRVRNDIRARHCAFSDCVPVSCLVQKNYEYSSMPHTATGLGTGSCTLGVSGDFRVTSVTGVPDVR